MGERPYSIFLGWAAPGVPILKSINSPSHIACIRAIVEIEGRQPWDIEKQQYRGRELKWEVINNESSSD